MIGQCPCDKHLQVAVAAAAVVVVVAAVAGSQYNGYLWSHLISGGYCFRHLTAEKAFETAVSAAAAVAVAEADDAAGSELVPAVFVGALVAWGPYWAGDKLAWELKKRFQFQNSPAFC